MVKHFFLSCIFNKRGVTLTELIIAAVLVTVVMAGVYSTDIGLRRINKQLTDEATAAIELVPMMNHIMNNALKIEGSPSDYGMCIDGQATVPICNAGAPYTFCFRATSEGNFYCYSQFGTELYACIDTTWVECTTGDFHIGDIAANTFNPVNNPRYSTVNNTFTITLDPVDDTLTESISASISPPGQTQ